MTRKIDNQDYVRLTELRRRMMQEMARKKIAEGSFELFTWELAERYDVEPDRIGIDGIIAPKAPEDYQQ